MNLAPERMLTVQDLMHVLGVCRRTIYNIPWFWDRVVYVGKHSPRWHASDLRLYQAMMAERPRER